ncbi:hypothetical protein [Conexibacter sp. SYSU D00693]|uniref:hypothetical protein n=1 Tax=Conexibacter sp. SYSU D00693 TaxID=2812560 RepID=UPI00196B2BA3|nr:hypothetical protein [Conexibacter sp. SYSU D00693]
MKTAVEVAAAAVLVTNATAGLAGAWLWWRVDTARWIWPLIRGAQVVAGLSAMLAGLFAAFGFEPDDGLFWLYVLLPVGVGFVAEQLRIASAEQVLEARGLPDAQAVGELDDIAQRTIVAAILRRELGVMVAAALVTAFLAARVFPTV